MRQAWAIAAAVVYCCLQPVATAQEAPFGGEFSFYDDKADRDPFNGFAKCIVEKYPVKAQTAIRENANIVADRKYIDLTDPHCLKKSISFNFIPVQKGHGIRFTNNYLVYRLSQAFIQKDYTSVQLSDIGKAAPLMHDERYRTATLEKYAECVTRSSSGQVRSLILDKADTPEEQAVFSRLQPAIKTCSTEESLENVPVFIWRGALAKELYLLLDEVMPIAQQEPTHA
jgi:hypothetical protein